MSPPGPLPLLAALSVPLLATLSLVGCGASGSAVRVQGHTVTVALEEYRVLPQTITVPAGRLLILVHNRGLLDHNLAVERPEREASGNPILLGSTATIMPGGSASLPTRPLPPGHYVLASTIADEADLGISATLLVR
jgi:hypothetical protein